MTELKEIIGILGINQDYSFKFTMIPADAEDKTDYTLQYLKCYAFNVSPEDLTLVFE